MKNFVMLSGIPRSGSQVLSSMLNQHEQIYSTTTSPLADMIGILADQWPNISQSVLDRHPDQFANMVKGLMDGAYKHIDKTIVVDKNRLWPKYHSFLQDFFEYKPKIICTVRSIPDVLSSYILLIERNQNKITYIDQDLINLNLPINNKNRCKILWEKYITHPYTSLRVGYNSGNLDLLFVEYDDIVNNSQQTIDRICNFVGVESYQINKENLQPMDENDEYHGGLTGLHQVRARLSKVSPAPEQVIGHDLANHYRSMKLEFWRKS